MNVIRALIIKLTGRRSKSFDSVEGVAGYIEQFAQSHRSLR